jgi:ParB-like chromosome segregation protein Spo0J
VVNFSGQEKRWPAESIERQAVAALVPYARNARRHSPEQIDQIAASIREWGWTVPVLVDEDGRIIAGHGRILAARKLGIGEVPAMVARGWSDAQKRAYVLADNKLTLNAGWDDDLLRIELSGLQELNFDLGLTGFSDLGLRANRWPIRQSPQDDIGFTLAAESPHAKLNAEQIQLFPDGALAQIICARISNPADVKLSNTALAGSRRLVLCSMSGVGDGSRRLRR